MFKLFRLSLILTLLLTVAGVVPVAGREQPADGPILPPNKIFLPLTMNNYQAFSVTGQVTDETGAPLSGVVLSSGSGMTTTTGVDGAYVMSVSQGDYSVAALKNGVGFLPPAMDLKVQENVSSLDFTGTGCAQLIANGGFDGATGWTLDNAEVGAVISSTSALKLGLDDPVTNAASVSWVKSDAFTIPETAKDPMLRLWIFTQSTTPTSKNAVKPERQVGENFFGPDTDANDHQIVQILTADGLTELEPLIDFGGSDKQEWGLVQFNLYKYTNQTIRLGFKVTNDGLGSATAMFVDDVDLVTCPTVYAPEGMNASALAPDACANQVYNSSFEVPGGWSIPHTAFPAQYNSNAVYPETVHTGFRSMLTGIPKYQPWANRYSYSDAWQTVYIPWTATYATLDVWVKLASTEALPLGGQEGEEQNLAETDPAFAPGKVWGQEPLAYDSSYILILNPYNGAILETVKAWPAKNNSYKEWTASLLAYRGQNIRIQYGAYNDGWDGVTSMYVDDLTVMVCDGGLPPPPPAASCLSGQTEQLINTSFETNNGWYRPVTAYTAHYTNLLWHTGARSMQTGITNLWHNRYSYSDFAQYFYILPTVSNATLTYWIYQSSGGGGWFRDPYDKQYLLILNNWGYWIDTLLWTNGRNSGGWQQVTQNVTYMRGYPLRLQFGTYNNGWYGVTSMFVDDVTLCTTP